jgi:hypothetical protein
MNGSTRFTIRDNGKWGWVIRDRKADKDLLTNALSEEAAREMAHELNADPPKRAPVYADPPYPNHHRKEPRMTDEPRFSVLVSTDEGVNWKLHRDILANTTEQACKRVQKAHYADDVHAMFFATQRFVPRKMIQRMVPRLGMQQVDLDPPDAGPTEEDAYAEEVAALESEGTKAPHQPPPPPAP